MAAKISGDHAASYKGDRCDREYSARNLTKLRSGNSPFENSRFAKNLLTALFDSQRMLLNSLLSYFKTRLQI